MGLQTEFRRDPNCQLSACSQGGEISRAELPAHRVCMCEEVRGHHAVPGTKWKNQMDNDVSPSSRFGEVFSVLELY